MVSESVAITDTLDDGTEVVGVTLTTTAPSAGFNGVEFNAFFRFLDVAVAQGAIVSEATLTLNVTLVSGTPNTTLYGVDADTAAAFADPGNLPSAVARTTASADPDPAGTGTKVITVTTIVQEIIDRAGWASGNAMAFVVDDNSGSGDNTWGCDDFEDAGTDEAQLDITYTVASSAAPVVFGGSALRSKVFNGRNLK